MSARGFAIEMSHGRSSLRECPLARPAHYQDDKED